MKNSAKERSGIDFLINQLLENQTFEKEGFVQIDLSVEHLQYLIQRAKQIDNKTISNL